MYTYTYNNIGATRLVVSNPSLICKFNYKKRVYKTEDSDERWN